MKKKEKPNSKQRIRHYSAKELEKALEAISRGNVTTACISKQFNIPRSTLTAKLTGRRPKAFHRPGPKAVIGDEMETQLRNWLLDCFEKGFSIEKEGLIFSVKKLISDGVIPQENLPFGENGPGMKWYLNFQRRHPEILRKKTDFINETRKGATEEAVKNWFEKVKSNVDGNVDIFKNPKRVYSAEETVVYLHPKVGMVISGTNQKFVTDDGEHHDKKNCTVLITCNANGDVAPPLASYSCEDISRSISALAPPDWEIKKTHNGLLTAEIFYNYISNVFYPYLIKKKTTFPIVLLLDCRKSHLSLQLSEFCTNNHIILAALQSNASHLLRPVDMALYTPLKKKWKHELASYIWGIGGREIERHDVAPFLNIMLQRESLAETLKTAFRSCGLCPFEPDAVNYEKCLINQDGKRFVRNGYEQNVSHEEETDNETDPLKKLESHIPLDILSRFYKSINEDEWNGEVKYIELFKLWKTVRTESEQNAKLMRPCDSCVYFPDSTIGLGVDIVDEFCDIIEVPAQEDFLEIMSRSDSNSDDSNTNMSTTDEIENVSVLDINISTPPSTSNCSFADTKKEKAKIGEKNVDNEDCSRAKNSYQICKKEPTDSDRTVEQSFATLIVQELQKLDEESRKRKKLAILSILYS